MRGVVLVGSIGNTSCFVRFLGAELLSLLVALVSMVLLLRRVANGSGGRVA